MFTKKANICTGRWQVDHISLIQRGQIGKEVRTIISFHCWPLYLFLKEHMHTFFLQKTLIVLVKLRMLFSVQKKVYWAMLYIGDIMCYLISSKLYFLQSDSTYVHTITLLYTDWITNYKHVLSLQTWNIKLYSHNSNPRIGICFLPQNVNHCLDLLENFKCLLKNVTTKPTHQTTLWAQNWFSSLLTKLKVFIFSSKYQKDITPY